MDLNGEEDWFVPDATAKRKCTGCRDGTEWGANAGAIDASVPSVEATILAKGQSVRKNTRTFVRVLGLAVPISKRKWMAKVVELIEEVFAELLGVVARR